MKKRLITFVSIITLLLCFCFVVKADNEEKKSGMFSYVLKGNGTAKITHFDWTTNNGADIYVPRMVDGYTVTEIGESAFSSIELPKDHKDTVGEEVVVVLPDTITVIGEKAFFCTNITSMLIPSSVQLIGPGALAGCNKMDMYNVAEGNQVYATIDGVLYNKTKKELVAYPCGYYANHIKDIPSGIKSIGDYAFTNCWFEDVYNFVFPDTITEVGKYAFYNVEYANLDLGSVSKIGDYAFAFSSGKNILGSFVTEVGSHCFYGAYVKFSFPEIIKIDEYAFSGSSIIDSIVFPKSLETIGESAFSDLGYIKQYFDFSATKLSEIPKNSFMNSSGCTVVLPNGITSIGDYAFYKSHSIIAEDRLKGLVLPDSVESIGAYAFAECPGASITSNSKIKTIGDYSFYMSEVYPKVLPEGLISIGERAFYSDRSRNISIPSSVSYIGEEFCNRANTSLSVVAGSYGAIYASENGYPTTGNEDTSWLND